MAQHQIEADQIEPVIAGLPTQQKLVLAAVLINERNGLKNIQTGQLYDVYDQACSHLNLPSLTQRRISGIIALRGLEPKFAACNRRLQRQRWFHLLSMLRAL